MDYSWDEAVSNLCHGANVYRFVTIDTGVVGNTSNNASKCATVAGCGGLLYGTESRGSSPENVAGCGKSHVKCWAWAWFVCSWPWRLWSYHNEELRPRPWQSGVTLVVTVTLTWPRSWPRRLPFSYRSCSLRCSNSVGVNVHIMLLIFLCCSFAASRNSTGPLPTTAPTAQPRKRRGGPLNRFIRQLRKLNRHSTNSNSTCEELKGCHRICVGQNEQLTNVSDCRTFKIQCTSRRLFRKAAKGKMQKTKNKKPNSN